MAAAALPFPNAEQIAADLTAQAHQFTLTALDKRKSVPFRRLARRRAQLLTYAAGALLRYSWTYDND